MEKRNAEEKERKKTKERRGERWSALTKTAIGIGRDSRASHSGETIVPPIPLDLKICLLEPKLQEFFLRKWQKVRGFI